MTLASYSNVMITNVDSFAVANINFFYLSLFLHVDDENFFNFIHPQVTVYVIHLVSLMKHT